MYVLDTPESSNKLNNNFSIFAVDFTSTSGGLGSSLSKYSGIVSSSSDCSGSGEASGFSAGSFTSNHRDFESSFSGYSPAGSSGYGCSGSGECCQCSPSDSSLLVSVQILEVWDPRY